MFVLQRDVTQTSLEKVVQTFRRVTSTIVSHRLPNRSHSCGVSAISDISISAVGSKMIPPFSPYSDFPTRTRPGNAAGAASRSGLSRVNLAAGGNGLGLKKQSRLVRLRPAAGEDLAMKKLV
ncbi:hypothetical protein J6590_043805 [Homalodisca vitripennis]|nr:hypothetical protein J6590_043805 [Homalodisca vitripennis]